MRETRLLPEASWKHCARCKRTVPEFEFSETLENKLDGLLKEGKRPSATALIVRQTGCHLKLAEAWAVHRLGTADSQQAAALSLVRPDFAVKPNEAVPLCGGG
jgi:hypothetical protein